MKFILHQCNDADRIQHGLNDPAFDGIEVDFHVYHGQVRIGHEASGTPTVDGISVHDVGMMLRETGKFLVVDLKAPNPVSMVLVNDARFMLEQLSREIPLDVPLFVAGYVRDWQPVVRATIDMWNGRNVTYFVNAFRLHHFQRKFRRPGIRFGLNRGYQPSAIKQFFADVLPAMLEEHEETADYGKALKSAFQPLTSKEAAAWKQADVRMAWTITSRELLDEARKLEPDYVIVDEFPDVDAAIADASRF
ncbi:MAG TPA: hypothetical protein VKM55_04050 [Candidatus Lokiarchaeia archaeon]|nr:hypothetical protein [Candidatus Lokiarchaeia archaeon]